MDYVDVYRERASEMMRAAEEARIARLLRRSRRKETPRKRDVLRFVFFPLSQPGGARARHK